MGVVGVEGVLSDVSDGSLTSVLVVLLGSALALSHTLNVITLNAEMTEKGTLRRE